MPHAVSQIDAEAEKVFLALTKERIENSPEVAEDEPISREKERALHEYYQWRPYWAAGANDPLNYGVFPTALAGALGTHSCKNRQWKYQMWFRLKVLIYAVRPR